MSKSDYYVAVGRPPETFKRLATGERRAAALPLFSPFFVHRSKVNAMRCSILLKPDRHVIEKLFRHDKRIQTKTGFSWNMNTYTPPGKSQGQMLILYSSV